MVVLIKILDYIVLGITGIGFVVIVAGVIKGIIGLGRSGFFKHISGTHKSTSIRGNRLDIAFSILLGLEFLIAADVINTIMHTTFQELAILGAIVGIRAAIGYLLDRELGQSEYIKPIVARKILRGKK